MSQIKQKLNRRSKGKNHKLGANVSNVKGVHQFVDPKRKEPFTDAKISAAMHTETQTIPDVKVSVTPALVKDDKTKNKEMMTKLVVAGAILGLVYLIYKN